MKVLEKNAGHFPILHGCTIGDIKAAYKIAARIVSLYGDAYIPIFNRLHKELEMAQSRAEIRLLAQQVAAKDD